MRLATGPGVEVRVCASGRPSKEYEDPDNANINDPMKQVKYIEAVPGTEFTVLVRTKRAQLGRSREDHIDVSVYMDGKRAVTRFLPANDFEAYSFHIYGCDRNLNGAWVMENFAFTALETDEGPLQDLQPADFKQLGEIEVRCFFVRPKGPSRPMASVGRSFTPSLGEKTLPEKVLKGRAISNKVSLSNPEPLAHVPTCIDVDYPYGKEPFGTYIFKYRSRKDLQVEHIIPRDPTPVPLEERDPETLTLEEFRELARLNRAKQAEQTRIKEEHVKIKKEKRDRAAFEGDEDADDDEVTITGESQSNKRARTSRDSGVEIVDLTDD